MENVNEIIMNNDEVMDVTEDVIANSSGMKLGFKIAIGAGITAIVGYAAYRFVVKPAIAKYKASKASGEEVLDNGNSVNKEIIVETCEKSA